MKNKIHKLVKKILKKYGFTLLKTESYNHLAKKKQKKVVPVHAKNNLLHNLFTLLQEQGFYPDTIYDIGANKGTWSKECLKYFSNATYYLFEPQINLKKDIEQALGNYPNYQLFSLGVGNENDVLNFTMHERDDSCSFNYSEAEAKALGFQQVKVPIVRLEDFVKEKQLQKPKLLKIDAEGLDLQVLSGAASLLNTCEIVLAEVAVMNPNMDNSALKMLSYMETLEYKLFDITDLNRPFKNRALWLCEFVFIKKNGILDKNYAISEND